MEKLDCALHIHSSFSIPFNGTPSGFFSSSRGLRQSDALPPPFCDCYGSYKHNVIATVT